AEERRGATPRYWDDVNVGDKLLPTVKGPLSTTELMGWDQAHVKLGLQKQQQIEERGNFEISIRRIVKGLDEDPLNTMTGFPYQPANRHYDWDACKSSGMPAPFDVGCFRACATSHLLSNYMGDDGFIRRFDLQLRKPMFYGDTVWYYAEVVKKYKDKVGDVDYGAVDIKINGTNQLGEVCAPATATVYLPSPGKPITLPIPHNDHYEAYNEYLSKCKELAEQREKTGNPIWPVEQ
ncbi:hypothetical protein MUP77_16955, partial [Candidatus Bathyarchaeota archaeon]|nr:hypothetical protein [Candidatus Bathyarchaeota archaeon]